jgi:hypothetical protein
MPFTRAKATTKSQSNLKNYKSAHLDPNDVSTFKFPDLKGEVLIKGL